MKKLILLRHGNYFKDGTDELTPSGLRQMNEAVRYLKGMLAGCKITIICSNEVRTMKSAELIASGLNFTGTPERKKFLNPDAIIKGDFGLIQSLDAFEGECLIAVTHMEVMTAVSLWLRDDGYMSVDPMICHMGEGSMWVIDLADKRMDFVRAA